MSYNSTAYKENPSYDKNYYRQHCGENYERGNGWEEIFAKKAEYIKRDFHPEKTLDVGCAAGYLVEGLRDRGVWAYGIDISEYAVSLVREDIRPYCQVQDAVKKINGHYDLITCIEVMEHLENGDDIKSMIHNLCEASDVIIFSSSPSDYSEETHYSVNQPGYWAEEFASCGFYHDIYYDCSYISPQAMVFRKRKMETHELVREYENRLFELWSQACSLRYQSNLSLARIADLDEGNIRHAQQLQEKEDILKRLEAECQEKISRLEVQSLEKYKMLEKRHVSLMQMEYEKRDVLETKFLILRSQKEFLESELDRCSREKHVRYVNAQILGFNMGMRDCLKQVLRYKVQTRKLLRKADSFWSPVFDADQYAQINQDVRQQAGADKNKLLRHFILYGMNEGRRANDLFDIHVYMECNTDVAQYYKGRMRDCYLHYIECGMQERRRAW